MSRLTRMSVRNYRALADVQLELRPINVVFGPNGAGKSTLLDSLYFFRDCAIRGVEVASSERDHGIGILWDGVLENERISVELANDDVSYALSFSLSAGRLDPFPGERLVSTSRAVPLIARNPGSDKAALYHAQIEQAPQISLREPDKLSLSLFLNINDRDEEAADLDQLLHCVRLYNSRSFHIRPLKRRGSESSHQIRLWDFGNNAWSVLRNLQDKRNVDDRYDTIAMGYMAEAFPAFDGIVLRADRPDVGVRQLSGEGTPPRDLRVRSLRRARAIAASADCPVLGRPARLGPAVRRTGSLAASVGACSEKVCDAMFARAVIGRHVPGSGTSRCFSRPTLPVLISQFDPHG